MAKRIKDSIEQNTLYWTLQITGWAFFFIVFVAYGIASYGFFWSIIYIYSLVTLIGFLISHLYRLYVKKREWHKLSFQKLAVRIVMMPIVLGFIWTLFTIPISILLTVSERELGFERFVAFLFNLSLILFMWNLIYFFYKLFTSYKQSEIEKWKLMAAVKDAQLMALKSQINPHFMFNSLNNIRSLVVENPEKAREMITHLSALLRYSIQFNNTEKVDLASEIDIVKYYLNLESIQFEDRLSFSLNVDKEALKYQIPPMAIQMLVENAIKHGISKLPEGGEISVDCHLEHNELVVEVINTGQIQEADPSRKGIGLQNATERLKLIFGKISELSLENINQNQVRAKFTIPVN